MDNCGFDMLGADPVAAVPSPVPTGAMTPQGLLTALMAPVYGSLIGSVVFGIGGALAWAAHRVAGGLLGGLLVGPAIGGGIGFVVAQRKITDVVATKMESK